MSQLDGALCTLVGYLIISACVFVLHMAARGMRLARLHRATGTCYLVLKVSVTVPALSFVQVVLLVLAEAVIFPCLCGWWLDACSLTLFSATLTQRIDL